MLELPGPTNTMKFTGCVFVLALASSSYAASLYDAKAVSKSNIDSLLNSRQVRAVPVLGPVDRSSLNNSPGPVDGGAAAADVAAAADAAANTVADKTDSSEDLDALIAELEARIAELAAPVSPGEVIAEKSEAKVAPPTLESTAPEQQAQAEQSQPDPAPGLSGPDNSNTEDGDGNGNNNGNAPEPGQNAQQDSGAGAPDPPAPIEPPQLGNGNGIDFGNEDTKS